MMMFASSLIIKIPGEISGLIESLEDLPCSIPLDSEIIGDIGLGSPCPAIPDDLMILEIAEYDLIRFLDSQVKEDLSLGPGRVLLFRDDRELELPDLSCDLIDLLRFSGDPDVSHAALPPS